MCHLQWNAVLAHLCHLIGLFWKKQQEHWKVLMTLIRAIFLKKVVSGTHRVTQNLAGVGSYLYLCQGKKASRTLFWFASFWERTSRIAFWHKILLILILLNLLWEANSLMLTYRELLGSSIKTTIIQTTTTYCILTKIWSQD
jgi:hypothetical protein